MITLKTPEEIEKIRKAGLVVAQILEEVGDIVKPGVTTFELDRFAEKRCLELGVLPAFKGYHGFTGCFCTSINQEVVHGIPSKKRELKSGDIIGLDFGVILEGWYADSAKTYPVGQISAEAQQLIDVTREGLARGLDACRVGNRLYDIGYAIQSYVEPYGYGIVRDFVGHGIGRALHEEPQIPNFGAKGKGIQLKAGMVLAIEPMINQGTHRVRVLDDGWTAVTEDGKLSAHFEHTVAIREQGPDILTRWP